VELLLKNVRKYQRGNQKP